MWNIASFSSRRDSSFSSTNRLVLKKCLFTFRTSRCSISSPAIRWVSGVVLEYRKPPQSVEMAIYSAWAMLSLHTPNSRMMR